MTPELPFSNGRVVLVLLVGLGLYLALRQLRSLVPWLPLSRGRRQLITRFRPLVEVLLTAGYVVVALRLLLGAELLHSAVSLAMLGLVVLVVSWFALRDLLAGLFIKAGELCLPGDTITLGELRGRVRSLGTRLLALDTDDGGQAFVPYSLLGRQPLVRHAAPDGAFRHTFFVELGDLPPAEAVPLLRRHILNCHWSSVVQEPRIQLDEGRYQVTLFALADHRGPTVEDSLARALKKQGVPADFFPAPSERPLK